MTAIRLGVPGNQLSDPAWLTRYLWLDGLAAAGNATTWVCKVNEGLAGFSVARVKEQEFGRFSSIRRTKREEQAVDCWVLRRTGSLNLELRKRI